jgi:hypothetical protein
MWESVCRSYLGAELHVVLARQDVAGVMQPGEHGCQVLLQLLSLGQRWAKRGGRHTAGRAQISEEKDVLELRAWISTTPLPHPPTPSPPQKNVTHPGPSCVPYSCPCPHLHVTKVPVCVPVVPQHTGLLAEDKGAAGALGVHVHGGQGDVPPRQVQPRVGLHPLPLQAILDSPSHARAVKREKTHERATQPLHQIVVAAVGKGWAEPCTHVGRRGGGGGAK